MVGKNYVALKAQEYDKLQFVGLIGGRVTNPPPN